jgi:dolichol-phosphate mannosyltransferase
MTAGREPGSESREPATRKRLAVVIPVYQAAETLETLLAELVPALATITPDFEILFVDDGSTDQSWARVVQASARDPRIRGLRLIRNFGEHVAITAGIDHVNAELTVIMACDLQDDPAAIAPMIRRIDEGCDLVLVRRLQRQDAWLKRTLARLFYAMISVLFGVDYDYRVGNFRLLSRSAVEYFRQYRERARNVNAIMALMGVRTGYVDVAHRARRHGRSTYTLRRSALMAANVLIGYSQIPLLVSGVIGGLLCVASLAWAAWLGGQWLDGLPVSNTAAILSVTSAIGGLLLLNLGVVGAYLGRAATEARERPMYFIDERTAGF